jgi:hypothetical protein
MTKIGVGAWETDSLGTDLTRLTALKFDWYYDWRSNMLYSPDPAVTRSVEYVPMLWDETHVNDVIPAEARRLLGFNEPNKSSQANMTVAQALDLWPATHRRNQSGRRVKAGSPATTTSQTFGTGTWQAQFMAGIAARGYKVDFMCVHWYPTDPSTATLLTWLNNVWNAYQRPIWVTEWCLDNWTTPGTFSAQDQADYAAAAIPVLNAHQAVKRHAWFAAADNTSGVSKSELWDGSGDLTVVGQAFQTVLNGARAPQDPED